MARYALVKDSKVINVVAWDGEAKYNPGAGIEKVKSDTANTGDLYQNGVFTPQAPSAEEIKKKNLASANLKIENKIRENAIKDLKSKDELTIGELEALGET